MNGREHLPPLSPNEPVRNLRTLAAVAAEIAQAMREEVRAARARGNSWNAISEAVAVRGQRAGHRVALGDLFPGGTSTTTVRRMYEEL